MSNRDLGDDPRVGVVSPAIQEHLARLRSLSSSLLGGDNPEVQQTAEALFAELRRFEANTRRPVGADDHPSVPPPETSMQLRFLTSKDINVGPEGFQPITLDRDTLDRVAELQHRIVEWIGSDHERAGQFGRDPAGTLERLGIADAELLTAVRREWAAQQRAVAGQEPDVTVTFRAAQEKQS